MKKLSSLILIALTFAACSSPAPTEQKPVAVPVSQFATVDCSNPVHAESTLVEWEWIKFELPWCWSAMVLPDSAQPMLVLKDEEGDGLLVLTYDPAIEPFELTTNTLTPEDPDTQLILNSFQE